MTRTEEIRAELTPYTLTNDEAQAARTAFNWALRTRFPDMHEAVCDLAAPALLDILLAVEVFASVLRFEVDGRKFDRSLELSSRDVVGSDRLPVGVDGWAIEGRTG